MPCPLRARHWAARPQILLDSAGAASGLALETEPEALEIGLVRPAHHYGQSVDRIEVRVASLAKEAMNLQATAISQL